MTYPQVAEPPSMKYPHVIETPNNLEKRIVLWPYRCCHTWECQEGSPVGHCGFCGERPRRLTPEEANGGRVVVLENDGPLP